MLAGLEFLNGSQSVSEGVSECPAVTILSSFLFCFIHRCFLTLSIKKSFATAVCPSVCTDSGPPVAGSCLPRGGREQRLQCPANPRHALRSLPLLRFQLLLCPEPVATTTQAGVCRSDEFQSRSSVDEGAYPLGLIFKCYVYLQRFVENAILFCILHKNMGFIADYCALVQYKT